jgi:malate/lactate dehydrogenase
VKISIIGTGWVGSTAAYTIATQGLAEELVLTDVASNIATAHSIDIGEAAAVCKKDTRIVAGSYADMAGSDIVIVTASAPMQARQPGSPPPSGQPSRRLGLGRNILLISEIGKAIEAFCPEAIVITTSNPVEALSYTSYLASSGRERKRFIGYTINDTTRFRVWISEALRVFPSDVDIFALGEHGDSQVPVFSRLLVGGKPTTLPEALIADLRKKPVEYLKNWGSLKSGRSSGWLSGAGLATYVRAIRENTKQVLPCSAILKGEYGFEGFSIGVPAIIGRDGIHEILQWDLNADERRRLAESAAVLRDAARFADEAFRDGFKNPGEAGPGAAR